MIDFKKYVKESHREDLLKLIKKHAKDGEAKLSLREMAEELDVSYQWVKIVLGELESLGSIEVKRGVKRRNVIRIC